jgi:GNAT superfamily N-acetyltransferase
MPTAPESEILRPHQLGEEWDVFVTASPQGSIFCRSWWLDAVCPDAYQVLVLRRGGRIVAGLAMRYSRQLGFDALHMPPITPILGVLLAPPTSANYEKNLSHEMDTLRSLAAAVPAASYFNTYCHYAFTNWLPFYWAGFQQTTFYTYAFEDLTDLQKILDGFHHSKRKNIKRAETLVSVRDDMTAADFFRNHELTLAKLGERVSYSREVFLRLHAACVAKGAAKTWYAIDAEDHIHAAIFVVFDERSAYYLVSSIDPDERNSGAATLLIKHALEYLAPRTCRFDFEGSMIEGVETSFRRFGAKQIPYFSLTRASRLGSSLVAARGLARRWRLA